MADPTGVKVGGKRQLARSSPWTGGEKIQHGHMTSCEIASLTPQLSAVSASVTVRDHGTLTPHVPTFRVPMGSGDQGTAGITKRGFSSL